MSLAPPLCGGNCGGISQIGTESLPGLEGVSMSGEGQRNRRGSGLLRSCATASGNLTALLGSQGFGASFPALASRSLACGIDVLLFLLADDDVAHLDGIRVQASGTLLTVGSNGHDSSPLSGGRKVKQPVV